MDRRMSDHDQYRTAHLSTEGVSTTEFGFSEADQADLVRSGFDDAVHFFREFDWDTYLTRFRR
jgi:hypothetical protein